jgi:hypothetical protein
LGAYENGFGLLELAKLLACYGSGGGFVTAVVAR